tara:strand:- start:2222 stop:2821 length:600 start_codon:yes stop_codon:yes gene_type:complete
MGEEWQSEAKEELNRVVLEDASKSPVENGYEFEVTGGHTVVLDLVKPREFSSAKQQACEDLGVDYEKLFPVSSTNPMFLWNIVKKSGLDKSAEWLLRLIDNAVSNPDARALLEKQAKEIQQLGDEPIEFEGNAIAIDTKRELRSDMTALSFLGEIALLSSSDREGYLQSVGIPTQVKTGKTTAEQKATIETYKERVLLV